VKFNEISDQASAEATGDYAFGAGVTVTQAKLSEVLVDPADQHLYQQVVLGVVGLSQTPPTPWPSAASRTSPETP
jgi:hypothetical protein